MLIAVLEVYQSIVIKREKIDDSFKTKCEMERWLSEFNNLSIVHGNHYACNIENQEITIPNKEKYDRDDIRSIAHEIGHAFTFRKISESFILKFYFIIKLAIYILLILGLGLLVLTILGLKVMFLLKIVGLLLTISQAIHWPLLIFTECLANWWVKVNMTFNKHELFILNLAVLNQSLYWLLFLVLTSIGTWFMFVKT